MFFSDDTKTVIIGILSSLIANALYDAFSYVCQYGVHVRVFVNLIGELRKLNLKQRAEVLTRLIGRISIGGWDSIFRFVRYVGSIHTGFSLHNGSLAFLGFVRFQPLSDRVRLSRLHQELLIMIVGIVVVLVCTVPFVLDRDYLSRSDQQAVPNAILNNAKEQLGSLIERDSEQRLAGDLVVSGWISDRGTLYQLNTTDDSPVRVSFPVAGTSIVGCAFTNPNHVVDRSNDTAAVVVSDLQGERRATADKCEYRTNTGRQWRSIICASYNPTSNPRYTVGVCASTSGMENLASESSRALMRQTTKSFYRELKPFLDQSLIQQSAPNRLPTTPAFIVPDRSSSVVTTRPSELFALREGTVWRPGQYFTIND